MDMTDNDAKGQVVTEILHACMEGVRTHLSAVTHLQHVPQIEEITALLQACEQLRLLHPLLEAQTRPCKYLAKMMIQNVPNHLDRLEIEAQVLQHACQKKLPTRALFEQQRRVKRKGRVLLGLLADVQAWLQQLDGSPSGGNECFCSWSDGAHPQLDSGGKWPN